MRWCDSVKNGRSPSRLSKPLRGSRRPRPRKPAIPGISPLEEQADVDRAVHWVIGKPGIFLNTAGDIQLLPKILGLPAALTHAQVTTHGGHAGEAVHDDALRAWPPQKHPLAHSKGRCGEN